MRISSTIRRAVQVNGDGIAIDYLDRQRTWSEFGQRIARLAGVMRAIGVEKGDRVAMLSLNNDRYLEFFFGVPWAGAVMVPINIRLAPPEVVHWLDDSGARVLLGDNVMLGYWKQPELSAETLRDGWLHTGDGGYMDEDGYIFIVDRVKDMIISGGENVYSAEVENAIHAHPAVAECAVIGVPDDKWGEAVHAIVRRKEGEAIDAETLIAHCHELIAGYKCPRAIDFVTEPLPLSGAGKILKIELRKPYWEGQDRQVH